MLKTFHFEPQPFVSRSCHFLRTDIGKIITIYPQCTVLSPKDLIFHSFPLLSHQTHIPKPILCARKKRRGSGSQKLIKMVPKLASIIAASYCKILPEPINLVIAELSSCGGGGSDGGGDSLFWKGFDGWKRKGRKINLGFLGVLIICGLGLVFLGKELKIDGFYGILALGLGLIILIKGFRRGIKDLVLEVCFVGALMGFTLKREDMQQWLHKIRVSSPVLQVVKGKRRRNGTRFF